MVLFSDFHLHDGAARQSSRTHQNAIFEGYVREVLAMRPLPANVVVFGDLSATCGWKEDYLHVARTLKPLSDAGIDITFGMGNHDNRANFLVAFPDFRARMLMKDRIVSRISTPNADLILLDSLKTQPGRDWTKADGRGNPGEGEVSGAQLELLRDMLAGASRPTFVGAHHSAEECGIRKEIVRSRSVFGYIYGHLHEWGTRYLHDGTFSNPQTVQTATLPSAGYYGDLGYATLRTFSDRAVLSLRQDDFFFSRQLPARPRPKNWAERVKMNANASVTFWYDKPGNVCI